MAKSIPLDEAAVTTTGSRDGLGQRVLAFVRSSGEVLELVRVRPELMAFEAGLREHLAPLEKLKHTRLVRVRGVTHEPDTGRLVIVSEHRDGQRLADLLDAARQLGVVPDLTVAVHVARELLAALDLLHQKDLVHGALAAERIVVTPRGQVALAEYGLGPIIERLRFRPERLWHELRLGIPPHQSPRFDGSADVAQVALLTVAMILGRALDNGDCLGRLDALVAEVVEVASIRASDGPARALGTWLTRALPTPTGQRFLAADEALAALDRAVPAGGELGGKLRDFRAFLKQLDAAVAAGGLETIETDETLEETEDEGAEAEETEDIEAIEEVDEADLAEAETELDEVETLQADTEAQTHPAAVEEAEELAAPAEPATEEDLAVAALADESSVAEELGLEEEVQLADLEETDAAGTAAEATDDVFELVAAPDAEAVIDAPPAVLEATESPVIEGEEPGRDVIDAESELRQIVRDVDALIESVETASRIAQAETAAEAESTPAPIEVVEAPEATPSRDEVVVEEPGPAAVEVEAVEKLREAPIHAPIEAPVSAVEAARDAAVVEEIPPAEPEVAEEGVAVGEPTVEAVEEVGEPYQLDEAPIAEEPPVAEPAAEVAGAEPTVAQPAAEPSRVPVEEFVAAIAEVVPKPPAPHEGAGAPPLEEFTAAPAAVVSPPGSRVGQPAPERQPASERPPPASAETPVAARAPGETPHVVQADSEAESAAHVLDELEDLPQPGATDAPAAREEPPPRQRLIADEATASMNDWMAELTALDPLAPPPAPAVAPAPSPSFYSSPSPSGPMPPQASVPPTPPPTPIRWREPVGPPVVPPKARSHDTALARRVRGYIDQTKRRTAESVDAGWQEPYVDPLAARRPRRRRLIVLAASVVLVAAAVLFAPEWLVQERRGTVVLESTPAGSAVLVDGSPAGETPITLTLTPGTHAIELRRGGKRQAITLDVAAASEASRHVDWSKVVATGTLEVTSEPAGAQVVVGGEVRGETPLRIQLPVGRHSVVLRTPSGSVSRQVRIEEEQKTSLGVPIFSGWIAIFAPVELQIFEGGRLLGTTENNRIMVPPGRHELELINEPYGYRSTEVLVVEPGEVKAVSIEPKGTVNLNATPWAEVVVDGQPIGETPLANVPLTIGTREVTFRHPEFGERKVTVQVTIGEPVHVNVDMAKPQG